MLETTGLRRHQRVPLDSVIRLTWQDQNGLQRVAKGKCVDISERGLGILVEENVPLRSYVQFRVEKIGFTGSGSVRYVTRKGLRYVLGLEFAGTLHWQSPA